jgi:RNA polymerase sigma factor (sigma-70 family)
MQPCVEWGAAAARIVWYGIMGNAGRHSLIIENGSTLAHTLEFDELMSGVAAGSDEAVWQLAETYTPYIIRAVRASLPPSVRVKLDSQDFAQTLWASLLLGGTDLTRMKTPEQLIGFLARAAKNKVTDATRHYLQAQKRDMSREQRLNEIEWHERNRQTAAGDREIPKTRDPTPSEFASVRERWSQILSSASERDRQIVQLRLERHTFEAISSQLKIDQETARRAIQRLIKKLSE